MNFLKRLKIKVDIFNWTKNIFNLKIIYKWIFCMQFLVKFDKEQMRTNPAPQYIRLRLCHYGNSQV